ncbi:carboxylesterase/lipase family protein [Phytohabitans suffuscus]
MGIEVTLPQGTFRGRASDGVLSFKGVPYAAAPVGDLRFAPPQPPPPAVGVVDASRYGPTVSGPPQRSAVMAELVPDPTIPGANGLNLSVWTPDTGASLPVFVWIHGGGFVTGTGAVTAFDGSAFARDGVVAVVVNYRLAVEGFLQIPGTVANRGLLDQVAALEWVRDNIAAFGGDPARVTVAGESAGGMSVMTLLATPRARGLFHRAISQSGDAHHVHTPDQAALVTAQLCADLGVARSPDALGAVPDDELYRALNEVIGTVQAGRDPKWRPLNRLVVQPVVDGDVLPRHPVEAYADGAGAGVALLVGTNANEYGLFTIPTGLAGALDEPLLEALVGRLGVDAREMIATYRGLLPSADHADLFMAIQGDWFAGVPIVRAIEAREKAGAPSYAYEFAWNPPTYGGRLGACHTIEVPFVFDTLADPWGARLRGDAPPQPLADEMHGAWVAFVYGTVDWPAYGRDRLVQRFDTESTVVRDPYPGRHGAWDGII